MWKKTLIIVLLATSSVNHASETIEISSQDDVSIVRFMSYVFVDNVQTSLAEIRESHQDFISYEKEHLSFPPPAW